MIPPYMSKKLEDHYEIKGDTEALKKQRLSNQTTNQIFLTRNQNKSRPHRVEKNISIYIYAIPVALAVISFALYYFAKNRATF